MSYVDTHLLPNERVIYRTRLHKIAFALPGVVAVIGVAGAVYFGIQREQLGIIAGAAVAVIFALAAIIPYRSSEFAVTDKRVIVKLGWIQRRTVETMLSKVEAIGVTQSIMGRMLNYGTILVTGTGGTREEFHNIAHPLEFRRQVQAQVSDAEDRRGQGVAAASDAARRDERECPYCAELILAKAKMCKYCKRTVTPLVVS